MNEYDAALQAMFDRQPSAGGDDGLFPSSRKGPGHLAAIERVTEWVRERFKLADDSAVSVSEIECKLPGCPPLETVVAFWENGQRYHFKIFKALAEVAPDNIPFAWLKDTLAVPEGFGCECC